MVDELDLVACDLDDGSCPGRCEDESHPGYTIYSGPGPKKMGKIHHQKLLNQTSEVSESNLNALNLLSKEEVENILHLCGMVKKDKAN